MIRRAAAAAAVLLLAVAASASGATGSLVGVHPLAGDESWVELALEPGASARTGAVLVNLTDARQTVEVGTADGVTTADGVFTLAGSGEAPTGVGAWIGLPPRRVTLAPGERRTVRFTVRVPGDAEPGDHAGGVVVQSASAARAPADAGVAVRVVERVGLRVYVTVAGERDETVAVDDLSALTVEGGARDALGMPEAVDVAFTVRHAGNVRFDDLRGTVELVRGGEVRARRAVALGTLLPGQRRPVAMRIALPWTPGDYEVVVRLGDVTTAQGRTEVAVSPVRPVATGALVIAVVGAGLRSRRRRAR